MATIRQKRVAKLKIENMTAEQPLTDGELVELGGFGPSMKKNPYKVMNSVGVQEELRKSGFTEENAKAVVEEIMLNKEEDANARLKASDQMFKVLGSYAPEKHLSVTYNVSDEQKERAKSAIRRILSRGHS